MNNKRMATNMIANIMAFAVNILVSFFMSPYIVGKLGTEAYGFISMITNLLSVSQIVTIAFNSMGARFITVALHNDDSEKAQKYFTSLFITNLLFSAVIFCAMIFVVFRVNHIFDVPDFLVSDVQCAFLISTVAFVLALSFSVFSSSTYATNRLDLSARRDMLRQFIRAGVILLMFSLFGAKIYYVSIATLVMEVYYIVSNYFLTKRLLPDFKIRRKYFSFNAIKELFSSGVWNSFGRLSYTFMSDLDLIIANLFISSTAMGLLSVSKTVPSAINSFLTTIVAVFIPTYTIRYAKRDINGLLKELHKAINIISVIVSPLLCCMIVLGGDFYALWQPTQDAHLLQKLSLLAILPLYFNLGMKSVNNVFAVVNKLFVPTIATFVTSVFTVIIEFVLLKYTNMGVLVIAGTSSVCMIVKDLFFVPIYASRCLDVKWHTFYPQVIKEFLIIVISCIIALLIKSKIEVSSWLNFIVTGMALYISIAVFNIVALFKREDYKHLSGTIRNKLKIKLSGE